MNRGNESFVKVFPKYIIAFSTIPTRIHRIIPFIKNLEKWTIQPELIFITLSPYYPRLRRRFTLDQIPEELSRNPRIQILWREDLGPINKLFWVLKEFRYKYDYVLTIDDDREYPVSTSEDLLSGAVKCGNGVVCLRGRALSGELAFSHSTSISVRDGICRQTDILLGTDGVLYPTSVFDPYFFEYYLESLPSSPFLRFCDDIYISGYLASKGIPIWVVHARAVARNYPRISLKRDFIKAVSKVAGGCPLDDRLWAINRNAPYNQLCIHFWQNAWRNVSALSMN